MAILSPVSLTCLKKRSFVSSVNSAHARRCFGFQSRRKQIPPLLPIPNGMPSGMLEWAGKVQCMSTSRAPFSTSSPMSVGAWNPMDGINPETPVRDVNQMPPFEALDFMGLRLENCVSRKRRKILLGDPPEAERCIMTAVDNLTLLAIFTHVLSENEMGQDLLDGASNFAIQAQPVLISHAKVTHNLLSRAAAELKDGPASPESVIVEAAVGSFAKDARRATQHDNHEIDWHEFLQPFLTHCQIYAADLRRLVLPEEAGVVGAVLKATVVAPDGEEWEDVLVCHATKK
ncbi:hypothetical protein OBBRIDRAFT_791370 [Obba rivulosa]|uniref:Uncharacterized protein n=1 Tax=Obba rivulosa TaxID=1052685 RepID=A0A8E2DM74_9APHY|nr:hypothetical protein OBBRIDRAFT_791370 [Obba rivulosa]